jgi:hypothetical protein
MDRVLLPTGPDTLMLFTNGWLGPIPRRPSKPKRWNGKLNDPPPVGGPDETGGTLLSGLEFVVPNVPNDAGGDGELLLPPSAGGRLTSKGA